jgi:hypothetical protein
VLWKRHHVIDSRRSFRRDFSHQQQHYNNTTTAILACSDFYVQFLETNNNTMENRITITVNGSLCDDSMNMNPTENGARWVIRGNSRKPPSLMSLYDKLVLGKNMIRYSLVHNTTNQELGIAEANLFV